jgi:hypothetical protein
MNSKPTCPICHQSNGEHKMDCQNREYVRALEAERDNLREAHQITLDWLMSDTVFLDYGQLDYHRDIVKAALKGDKP